MIGNIPPELGSLTNLTNLFISNNRNLSGTIPPELGNLTNLTKLTLVYNNLSGTIPTELGNLSNLGALRLENNQLTGGLPVSLANLTNLYNLMVANNNLTGCYAGLETLCSQAGSNQTISNGNFFDVPWQAFCATGSCTPHPCIAADREALIAVYIAVGGSNSSLTWDTTRPVNTWDRIDLDANGCVITIDFEEENLVGTIAPEIGNLSELEFLVMGGSQLGGTLPPEIGNLSSLMLLAISGSQISGPIPPELGNLSNLEYLSLGYNQLSGNIPPELGNLSNLTTMLLINNQLSGNIPPELAQLSNLNGLLLGVNQLTGNIPAAFGNLPNLNSLSLINNQLSGCYDVNLAGLCSQLFSIGNSLISDGNNFDIPWEYFCNVGVDACACPTDYNALAAFANSITYWGSTSPWDLNQPMSTWEGITLNADGCVEVINLDDEHIAGTIPPELGNLTALEYLDLGSNQISGSIPPELGNLSSLTFLNLNNNSSLTGSLPPELGNLVSLESMYINYNNLNGSLPPELGNLTNLKTLSIRSNQLSGDIPDELGNLSNLIYLSLDGNQLTGTIPASLGSITSLVNLSLRNNQLSGCYDMSLQNLCSQLSNYFNSNAQISDGNSFDAPWEDFCATEIGACDGCPTDLNLSNPLSTGTYQASETLSSESTVPTGTDVQFKAGDEILLDNGFSVEPGSNFSGEVGEDCNDN